MKKCIIFPIFMILIIALAGCFDSPDDEDFILALNNNGADGDALPEELYYNESTVFDLPGAGSLTRIGFSFNGWNTESDGSGVAYIAGASFIMPGENITLYAQWVFAPATLDYTDLVTVTGGIYTHTDTVNFTSNSFTHTISSYKIGKYEITYELWYVIRKWAEENSYYFEHDGEEGHPGIGGVFPGTDKYEPVMTISWRDAIVWCNAYSELSGLTPTYLDEDENVIKDSRDANADDCDNAVWNHSANGYRLPSEGEWHYAASARGVTPYYYAAGCTDTYTNETALAQVAWYRTNAYIIGMADPNYGTHNVGTKLSNSLDLYDMSGNAPERCWDWYADSPTQSQNDYYGPVDGIQRVIRGGGWQSYPQSIIIGARSNSSPDIDGITGLRIAKNAD
ncbi:MAG: SUMF1/EgtB/PvdO family nonheme iron enzyme [Candidatus Marinimicrobia bacterium]|nr:SUMF1/EgtB/PvdO family nonheme iron enzyme [Candidatus Neomarinimicrobiota bacterium]